MATGASVLTSVRRDPQARPKRRDCNGPPHGANRPEANEPGLGHVGDFEIVSMIGRGGMGCVYRARDRRLGREVALKCPRPDLLTRQGFKRRFLKEARAASRLQNPNVATVFEVFEEGGVPWLAMELADRGSLRSQLIHGAGFSVEEVVEHSEGLAGALYAAHTAHILHCDINPNNVLVGSDGRLRLTDFGLARAHSSDPALGSGESTLTATSGPDPVGNGAGTRGYMSPEQVLGRDLDPRSDIFCLGLVMYEMCTGEPAFPSSSESWLDALLHHDPAPIQRFKQDVPPELERIILKCVAKRADERYQTAEDLRADLRVLRRRLESGSGSDPLLQSAMRRRRPAGTRIGLAACGMLALGAAVFWLITRGNPTGLDITDWAPRQLTGAPGWEAEPAIAPDGTVLAYSSNESGNSDIWLLDLAGGSTMPLTRGPGDDRNPVWFPDGSSLAFASDRSGQWCLWKIPRLGGQPVLLVENARYPAISPQGDRLAFSREEQSGLLRLAVADLHSGETRFVSSAGDGLWDHVDPTWSPDGRRLCYADFRDLWVVELGGGEPRRLTDEHGIDGGPVWSPCGRFILFSSARDGNHGLWTVPVSGDRPKRVTFGTGPVRHPCLSADQAALAYSTLDENRALVVLDVLKGTRNLASTRRKVNTPEIANDGSGIVYSSNRSGKYDLWYQPLHEGRVNGPAVRVTDHEGSAATPDLSPDGRWVAYFRVVGGQRDVWLVPTVGGIPTRITEHPGVDVHPVFSPDGASLAFVSDRVGFEQVWVIGIRDGARAGTARQVSHAPAVVLFPAWSRDGTSLAYVSDGEVWVVDVTDVGSDLQATQGAEAQEVAWLPSGKELLVSGTWGGEHSEIRRVSLLDGSVRPFEPVLEFGSEVDTASFSIDGQGRWLTFQKVETKGDIWILRRHGDDQDAS
jgi:Tol biopolymer transport system component